MLLIGAITVGNAVVVHDQPMDWAVPVATGLAAGALALLERVNEPAAVGLAWLALVTMLIARVRPDVPSPAESILAFINGRDRP
jgi:hypothetical protein